MGADAKRRARRQGGQSILEFAFFLPIFLGFIYYLMQITMAVNSAVVFQQYTRARLFEMFYNHPDYPALRYTAVGGNRQAGWQRFWLGADRESWNSEDVDYRSEGRRPNPPVVNIGRRPAGDDDPFPPTRRREVRVRVISFVCMPPKLFPSAGNSSSTGPQFATENSNDYARNLYKGGFGTHVNFCVD